MELIKLIAVYVAGCITGFAIGYLMGSDNGFVKGCNWAYCKVDKSK
jgi:hypothetical protein